ncbi:DUF4260 domain-containing protein [Bauldia sp.]|uniref:DUF4260 domain-containing protein n=1 Tax=Bauldia sp. TaxID=2575872 RepID=UPI003BAB4E92
MSRAETDNHAFPGARGSIRTLLRLEGLALLVASVVGYALIGSSWWLFAILFLAPDLTFVAFSFGPRVGAIAYDAAHTTIGPAIAIVIGLVVGVDILVAVGLIWTAHIGMDRAIGYGLRYPASFQHTHLGRVGKTPT